MADQLTEYFVRHYTLVIDNDQGSYNAATRAAVQVVRGSGIARAEYEALTSQERRERFAAQIGDEIMELIADWFNDAVSTDTIGGMLASEIMILASGDIEWYLGDHYMPEDGDVLDLLDDDEDDE